MGGRIFLICRGRDVLCHFAGVASQPALCWKTSGTAIPPTWLLGTILRAESRQRSHGVACLATCGYHPSVHPSSASAPCARAASVRKKCLESSLCLYSNVVPVCLQLIPTPGQPVWAVK